MPSLTPSNDDRIIDLYQPPQPQLFRFIFIHISLPLILFIVTLLCWNVIEWHGGWCLIIKNPLSGKKRYNGNPTNSTKLETSNLHTRTHTHIQGAQGRPECHLVY